MQLGRYQILKQLATGSVADVLLARASGLEGFARHVVIKRIQADLAREERFVRAFLDEARIAASLHHQNIVTVHDIGEQDGSYFFAMEYVHGEDARKLINKVRERSMHVPLEHALSIVMATAAGLHHAHEQMSASGEKLGLVHRDVSPANILIGYDGSVKIVDFGMAKAVARSTTTATGLLKGKTSYMSPEQCTGKAVDRRTDIFALGIVLFELITAERLFKGSNEFMTMAAIVEGEIPRPSSIRREVPPALDEIIMRALQRSPESRYQTAEAFRDSLEAFALAQEMRTSTKALADYLTGLFGERIEPWEAQAQSDALTVDPEGTHAKGLVPAPSADPKAMLARLAPPPESPMHLAQSGTSEWTDDDEFASTAGEAAPLRKHDRQQTANERPPSEELRTTQNPVRTTPSPTGGTANDSQPLTISGRTGPDTNPTAKIATDIPPRRPADATRPGPLDETQPSPLLDTMPGGHADTKPAPRAVEVPSHDDVTRNTRAPGDDPTQNVRPPVITPTMRMRASEDGEGRTVVEPPIFDRAIYRQDAADDDEFGEEPATEIAPDPPSGMHIAHAVDNRAQPAPRSAQGSQLPRSDAPPAPLRHAPRAELSRSGAPPAPLRHAPRPLVPASSSGTGNTPPGSPPAVFPRPPGPTHGSGSSGFPPQGDPAHAGGPGYPGYPGPGGYPPPGAGSSGYPQQPGATAGAGYPPPGGALPSAGYAPPGATPPGYPPGYPAGYPPGATPPGGYPQGGYPPPAGYAHGAYPGGPGMPGTGGEPGYGGGDIPRIDLVGRMRTFIAANRVAMMIGGGVVLLLIIVLAARGCGGETSRAATPADASDVGAESDDTVPAEPAPSASPTKNTPTKKPTASGAR